MRKKIMKDVFILIIFLTEVFSGISQSDTIIPEYHVPGTDVSIIPPKYFVVLPVKNTLFHPATSSTIQVNEIKGTAYPLLMKNITPEYLEKQNARFISKKEITTNDGKKATLILVAFTVEAKDSSHTQMDFERYMFFTGNYNETVWINANYPVIARGVIADVLLKCLLSVKFKD